MKTFILLLVISSATICLVAFYPHNSRHKYIIAYEKQAESNGGYQTANLLIEHTGTKFTIDDYNWTITNIISGNTNMVVVILNIIKLDD